MKGGSTRSKVRSVRIRGTRFRWVVPQLPPEVWSRRQSFKAQLLDRLLASKTARKGLQYYCLAIESHADGNPHLDLLLVFRKRVELTPTQLDFLCQKHGDLTRYRTLNAAILAYGSKQDTPLTNRPQLSNVLAEDRLKTDPYAFLEESMLRDPYGFDLGEFVKENGYARYIRNWASVKGKLKDVQTAACNLELKAKPGIRLINDRLIRATLTESQYLDYLSWSGYQSIVDYINEIFHYGCRRPFKAKQLLLVGPPNSGKTTLNRRLSEFVATYEVGLAKWFPAYTDGVYRFFSWNEFSLNSMPYPTLLKLLEGSYVNLERKGGSVLKCDNQLIIMNSNFSLARHLTMKFGAPRKIDMLGTNLVNLSARIHQIQIPANRTVFLLLKLIQPNEQTPSSALC